MLLSYHWLAGLVEGLPGVDEVARRLTMGGIEVESIRRPERAYGDTLAIGRIAKKEQHPNADRLSVCTVDDGSGAPRTIVCGAKNHQSGDTVVVARVGCELPGGLTIRRSKLRGVESEGMLCSAAELGLADGVEGILILEEGIAPGTPAAPLLGLDDVILELGITPNRGDCLSMIGLAREVAALCGLRLKDLPPAMEAPEGTASVAVAIRDAQACPAYRGLVLRGVKVGPSPTWLRTRLSAAGLRSINTVVDVTNFVLIERGQPLHAFDLSLLRGGRIEVRRAEEGEKIAVLDGSEVELRAEDLVIADAVGPVALAGVIGGQDSAVRPETTDLFLEAALFSPSVVRRSSRRHGVLTDSSFRFERGIDPAGVEASLFRAASLLVELAGASVEGGVVRCGSGPAPRAAVLVRPSRVNALLGQSWSDEHIASVLAAGGADPVRVEGGFSIEPPSHRHDLEREIDFVEEVARIVGYDRIAPAMPMVELLPVSVPDSVRAASDLRGLLSGLGLCEHVAVSFASEADNARYPGLWEDRPSVIVRNPLRSDATAMQKSALPALLAALRSNLAMQQPRVDLFSVSRTFARDEEGRAVQKDVVAGLLYGPRAGTGVGKGRELAFADLKDVVARVLALLAPRAAVEFVAVGERPEFHPRAAAQVLVEGRPVGFLGRLHPDIAEDAEIAGEIYVFEVDCRETVAYRPAHPGLKPIPRYPSSERDLSLLVDLDLPAGAAIRAVGELHEPCLESISVFDEYTGTGVGSGRKALGYRLVYRAADRTLTEAEVSALHEKVVGHLTGRLGAQVRI
jgi:phenylalanyl-tRNA synthetase beta chain